MARQGEVLYGCIVVAYRPDDMAFKDISTAQERILIAYKMLTQKLGQCPTASEVAKHMKITTRAVFTHLEALEEAKYLIRRPGRRNVILTDKAL